MIKVLDDEASKLARHMTMVVVGNDNNNDGHTSQLICLIITNFGHFSAPEQKSSGGTRSAFIKYDTPHAYQISLSGHSLFSIRLPGL